MYNLSGPEEAAKLLVIHGFCWFTKMNAPMINILNKKYRVLSVDLPGHGDSDAFDKYTTELFIDVLAAACEHNKFDEFYITGHSMGGYLALYAINS